MNGRRITVTVLTAAVMSWTAWDSDNGGACRADEDWERYVVITPIPLVAEAESRRNRAMTNKLESLSRMPEPFSVEGPEPAFPMSLSWCWAYDDRGRPPVVLRLLFDHADTVGVWAGNSWSLIELSAPVLDTVFDAVFPLSWSDRPVDLFEFGGFWIGPQPGPAPHVLEVLFRDSNSPTPSSESTTKWWSAWDKPRDGKDWSPLKLACSSVGRSDLPSRLVSDVTIESEETRFCFQYTPLHNIFRSGRTDQEVILNIEFTESASQAESYFRSMDWMLICLDKWICRDEPMITSD